LNCKKGISIVILKGKKQVTEYSDKICKLLRQYNIYCQDDQNFFYINLNKKRKISKYNDLKFETCEINLPTQDFSDLPIISNNIISKRRWISISFEGTNVNIEQNLKEKFKKSHILWHFLNFIMKVNVTIPTVSSKNNYIPVLGGYPQFIRFISGNASVEEISSNFETCALCIVENTTPPDIDRPVLNVKSNCLLM
jgi:phenylalanyl-tRNA synthetase alpha subunit